MTPQEQAKELFQTFFDNMPTASNASVYLISKECALIAVNELIKHCSDVNSWYWEEVKQEIEKL